MNNKLLVLCMLVIFFAIFSIGSVSAIENMNSSDNLTTFDGVEELKTYENIDSLEKQDNYDNLTVNENSSEILAQTNGSEILSTSVSVSNGHTYHKLGYTFKVSASQYKKIKNAIKSGKKQQFLDNGFEFKVKTNKVIKTKVLVKSKTYYKKIRYEGLTYYPYRGVKLANLKYYYKNGWKKYQIGYESAKNSKKYLGYNFVKIKKTVKKYKTVHKRVYAIIGYVGINDYKGYGEWSYYPWVSFEAQKRGYSSDYLEGTLIKN